MGLPCQHFSKNVLTLPKQTRLVLQSENFTYERVECSDCSLALFLHYGLIKKQNAFKMSQVVLIWLFGVILREIINT
ncbi:hypothetical protein L596_001266 [Steinernema carpocapsae]|uniref:Uncharacterized protein n=1 Tax=Steinernema carpocapsae TaxID=34508 RepID=A0A4U8UMT5_STECR|nr:hypothetical protein L596_001266 [Steinernema carpocapsae]